ncbi:MAG: tyrosine-type recombinase/integrase [Planctomycetota bacterium]
MYICFRLSSHNDWTSFWGARQRHTCGSLLAAAGVHPKVVQKIMRHTDINLTMSLYTHVLKGQESEAVNALPDLSAPSSQAMRKTGTDDLQAGL